jgi:SAM-dependent methyltransferase
MSAADPRPCAPSAERNKDPILAVLREVLPPQGRVLEIASGTGQHVAHFAAALPQLTWQPTEADAAMLASIRAWIDAPPLPNVAPPQVLDVHARPWSTPPCDAVVCINMIHISPWSATAALIGGAAEILPAGGVLYLYGPYRRGGAHTAPSNERFDEWLRAQDRAWGVRDLEAVQGLAEDARFALERVVPMPANNLSVVFRKR